MTAPRHPNRAAAYEAVVAVRVPNRDGHDLATSASRRLERAAGVETVDVLELRGLDPALSATVATVAVVVRAPGLDCERVQRALASAPGTEQVLSLA